MSVSRIVIPPEIKQFLEVEYCDDFPVTRYYVTDVQEEILREIIKMRQMTNELRKMNIDYLNTTLLYGPTGTGKTTFGRYIAYALDYDFAYVNFAKLVEGVFGNTARNISEIFRFMADTECIFMLDEIDCISQKRGTESAATGGELSRITITLMQELDYYKKHKVKSVIIGATNRVDIMDEALLSRFSLQKRIGELNNEDKIGYIELFLNDVNVPYSIDNLKEYAASNSTIKQRNIEADIIRCIAEWIDHGKQGNIYLKHIKSENSMV